MTVETLSQARLITNQLFSGISPDLLERLLEIPDIVSFEANEVIFDESDPGDFLYLIASGAVRISKRGRGGQQETLAFLEAGEFFGEMALYDPAPRSARAMAVDRTLLGRVDRLGLERMLRIAPMEVSANLARGAIRRLRQTNAHFIEEVLEAERLSLIGSMVSSILHDLRNPISVILNAAAMLEEPLDPARLPWLAGLIRRSVDRTLEMTQEILDYSRGTLSLRPEPVTVDEMLRDLRLEILDRLASEGYGLDERVSYRGALVLDWPRFRRVLINILRNAAEAMPDGGRISLSLELTSAGVTVQVADTGCGIPPEVLPRIFEPFVTHGKAAGTGLGMAIAKSIVEAHGGSIQVESAVGAGTCFTIVLPRSACPQP